MFEGFLAFGIGMVIVTLLFFVLGILSFIFWIAMIIDCIKRKFKAESDKIVWILVLIFTGIIGALIYYFVVRRK